MTLQSSSADSAFRTRFEKFEIAPDAFNHRAHLRLAYVYLVESDVAAAYEKMRRALHAFLKHLGIEKGKYHDTMTRAWILAVRHFMEKTESAGSADDFIDRNPEMLDTKIMLRHYSAELLFSDEARDRFVEPDLDPIPRYGD